MAKKRPPRRVTIQVLGADEDKGHVRLLDFIRQLEVVRNALRQTERLLSGSDEGGVYWRVVDLRHDSPATVVLEEVDARPGGSREEPVIQEFIRNLRQISKGPRLPENERRDLAALEAYKALSLTAERHVRSLSIKAGRTEVAITETFRRNIDQIIGPDEVSQGSMTGVLEAVNLHNTLRFNIYPVVGPKKVTCTFEPETREQVIRALDRYVHVYGNLRYKRWAPFPHAIDVHRVEVYPPDSELPRIADLRGIAPDATGEMSSEDFIEELRDGGW